MTAELLVRSSVAPVAIVNVFTTLVPAALLGVPLAVILSEPADTFSPAPRTFFGCAGPAAALVTVLPVAVRLPLMFKPVPAAEVIVVLSLSTTGGEIV